MHIAGPQRWAGRQRWSIATRKSASIFGALVAIATATRMGGRKKRRGQRWSLAAALKKLWVPTFVRKIALLRFSKNGMHTAMLPLNSVRECPGTGSSTREFIYSKRLHGTIGFELAVRRRICKLKSYEHCQVGANALPIWMPSGRSMASIA